MDGTDEKVSVVDAGTQMLVLRVALLLALSAVCSVLSHDAIISLLLNLGHK